MNKITAVPPCRCVKFFLLFSLFSLLFFSCPDSHRNSLPPGYGTVSIRINGSSRAITPDGLDADYFDSIELVFSGPDPKTVTYTDASTPIPLAAGTYSLTVNAYIDPDTTPAATATKTGIEVTSGGNTPVSVTLYLTQMGTGKGYFAWDVEFVETVIEITDAHMYIYNDDFYNIVYLNQIPKNSFALDAGIYTLSLDICGKDKTDYDKLYRIQWFEIVYIYTDLTSTYENSFNADSFYREAWAITFHFFDEYGDPVVHPQSFYHGDNITLTLPGNRQIVGLYTNPGFTGDNYLNTPVVSDMVLYAKYQLPVYFYPVSFDPGDLKPKLEIDGKEYTDGDVVTVKLGSTAELKVLDAGEYDEITWLYNNEPPDNSYTYLIDTSSIGLKLLTVEVLIGSVFYSTSITISVSEFIIGDTGPGGGIIFYVEPNPAGFALQGFVNQSGGPYMAKYLEAAPSGWQAGGDPQLRWMTEGFTPSSPVGTAEGIGEGKRNTALILAADATAPAAKACVDYTNNGYKDWFLPSIEELQEVYAESQIIGGTVTGASVYYWSSTEANWNNPTANASRLCFWSNGVTDYLVKYASYCVRPIRAFGDGPTTPAP